MFSSSKDIAGFRFREGIAADDEDDDGEEVVAKPTFELSTAAIVSIETGGGAAGSGMSSPRIERRQTRPGEPNSNGISSYLLARLILFSSVTLRVIREGDSISMLAAGRGRRAEDVSRFRG